MLTVYRASAGSGKTFRLTGEYIRLLFKDHLNNRHRTILAVTFTNKATGEMKTRIIEELHRLACGDASPYLDELMREYGYSENHTREKAGKILINILHDYSSFSISTIDKYFQQVIRAFAREMGVHGGYALELDTAQVLEQAVDTLFFELSAASNKQLLEWLTRFAEERIEQAENWNMQKNILDLGREIFKENYQYKAREVVEKLHNREFLKQYREQLNAIADNFISNIQQLCTDALTLINKFGLVPEDFRGGSRSQIKVLEKLSEKLEVSNTFRQMAESVEACYTQNTPQGKRDAIISLYNSGLQAKMQQLLSLLDTGISNYNTTVIIKKHLNTLGILADLSVQIQKLTNEQNIMLIADSNQLLNNIIDNSETPFIYEKTGQRIEHFMIDEFQDTSVMQWKNFLPLIRNSLATGNDNLVVGDVKQSIYRWRNSDWKLLDYQLYSDFGKEQLTDCTLDTNFRSDRSIVEFNNEFFTRAADMLQDKLNESVDQVINQIPELGDMKSTICNAYQQSVQQTKPDTGEGYVTFSFIDDSESEQSWKEISLNCLPQLVEDLQGRGFRPCDIAFLVRTNNEEQLVIEYLLNYKTLVAADSSVSYDIIGNEGLMVASAASVRFITNLLYLFVHPGDKVRKSIVTYEYGRGELKFSDNDALAAVFGSKISDNLLCGHFSEEENEEILQLRNLSLFEMCEQLIFRYKLEQWHGEAVFLQAFQDIIFNFSTGKTADLNSFLDWWDKNGERQTIAMPENDNAMRIMTIHKSKGLDFKVVIMPFCDWDTDSRMRPVLWCETEVEPFSQLPLLPVEYTSRLGKSVFARQYYTEMMHTFIDNLNIAYVAFTRARNEMHCLCRKPSIPKNGIVVPNNISSLIYLLFSENTFIPGYFDPETLTYTLGNPAKSLLTAVNADNIKMPVASDSAANYPVALPGNRLHIRHRINNFNREETDLSENPLDYGNLMHEILSELDDPVHYRHLTDKLIRQGRISAAESELIIRDLEEFRRMPEVNDWFQSGIVSLNETTIVTPQGKLYRPDRVIIDGQHATVIDYKFGASEHSAHLKQVEQYAGLLNEMGYSCSGYLCYVKLKKVISVV